MDQPNVAACIFDLVGNGTFVFQLLITSDFARVQLIKNQLFNLRVRQSRHQRKIGSWSGYTARNHSRRSSQRILRRSESRRDLRRKWRDLCRGASGVADGCTSNPSVKRQATETISITNSDVIPFKVINLIPPVAHSICQIPTYESQSFARSHLSNHTTISHVA